jgi:peptidoglycan hydrolase CwlO-like protein
MIDLNGSSDEIAAAKKAAANRHEKLVLLSRTNLQNQINQLNTKMQEIENKRNELIKKYPKQSFNGEALDAAISSLSKSGQKFETVIISGHHGSEYFGYLGNLDEEEQRLAWKR